MPTQLLVRVRQYKEELLVACQRAALLAPVAVVRAHLPAFAELLQGVLRVGLGCAQCEGEERQRGRGKGGRGDGG